MQPTQKKTNQICTFKIIASSVNAVVGVDTNRRDILRTGH